MKEYGVPDPDTTAYCLLLQAIQGKSVECIMHYPRVAINARQCKMPGSLKIQALLLDKTVVTVTQAGLGKPAKVQL